MDELLNHIDFIIALVAIVAGYADVRTTVKSSVGRLDKFEETVLRILERLEANDREDAVREQKITELTAHKEASNQSKDEAIGKLNKIETLIEMLIKQNDERHEEYKRRFETIESKI